MYHKTFETVLGKIWKIKKNNMLDGKEMRCVGPGIRSTIPSVNVCLFLVSLNQFDETFMFLFHWIWTKISTWFYQQYSAENDKCNEMINIMKLRIDWG